MAGNSMVALMLMLLLCFIGMLVMFLFVIRSNTVLSDSIKEATRQQRQTFNDIERQLLELSFTVNKVEVKEVCSQYEEFSRFAPVSGQSSSDSSQNQADLSSLGQAQKKPGDLDRGTLASKAERDSDLPKLSL